VWDNGIEEVTTPFSSQLGFFDGTVYDVFTADDFIFDEEITVTSVFWTGLYFNCQQAQGPKDYHFPWRITFFEDDGSSFHPGDILAGPFNFLDSEISREFLGEVNQPNMQIWAANYDIELSEPVTFEGNTKYWITIYGDDDLFPQSGVGVHNDEMGGIRLNEANIKSQYWYDHGAYPSPDWFNVSEYEDVYDMNFMLIGLHNNPPDTPIIDGQTNGKTGVEYEYTFTTDDPNGDDISYCIDWGDDSGEACVGPFPSGEEQTVSHAWDEDGTYRVKIKATDQHGAVSDWATLEVSMPLRHQTLLERIIEWILQIFGITLP
jgi:hypothetical protein